MLALSMPLGAAQAALIGTEQVVSPSRADADRARVATFMTRGDVRAEMRRMGVDPAEAERRIAVMSDVEIGQIAARINEAPAGQGAIGTLVGAALLVFIILLITDLAGLPDVFPFVKSTR
jgi:hypothetical protein